MGYFHLLVLGVSEALCGPEFALKGLDLQIINCVSLPVQGSVSLWPRNCMTKKSSVGLSTAV